MRMKNVISAELLVILLTFSIIITVEPATTSSVVAMELSTTSSVVAVEPATTSKALQEASAKVGTDKASYYLSATVLISGWEFKPEIQITVTISRPDDSTDSWSDVTSDTNGAFVTSYTLDGMVGIYNVIATEGTNTAETTFEVSAWVIWTDKSSYEPEESVTIFGVGFEPDGEINVTVARPDYSINTWSVSADAYGNFTTTYILDGITGYYQVTATDGIKEATTSFTDASITLNPSFGPPGTSVTVTGDGFYGLGGVYFDSLVTPLFTATGSFIVSFDVPDWAVIGQTYTVEAGFIEQYCTNPFMGGCLSWGYNTYYASESFTVTRLILTPSSGPPGTHVTVLGDGLWGDGDVKFDSQVVASFSAAGSFSVSFDVPDWAVIGQTYTVEATSEDTVCEQYFIGCLKWVTYVYSASESFAVTSFPIIEGSLFSNALALLPLGIVAAGVMVIRRRNNSK